MSGVSRARGQAGDVEGVDAVVEPARPGTSIGRDARGAFGTRLTPTVDHRIAVRSATRERVRARIALLGTGTVGRAVLQRLTEWQGTGFGKGLELVHVANSREAWRPIRAGKVDPSTFHRPQPGLDACTEYGRGGGSTWPRNSLEERGGLQAVAHALGTAGPRILIDATPSEQVAAQHAHWLERGIHVVTACKLARGTALEQWQAIEHAKTLGHAHYGDAATVGAGLPLLRSIRELRDGGDRIHSITGVLSGSLAWLFHHYDGMRSFSALVRQAREAGYTEPDPREDLSGEDVRRKLLILARAAGVPLDAADVRVDSLVPSALSILPTGEVDSGLDLLDAPLRARYAQAWKTNEVLRFVARLEDGRARVGLESLPASHPLAGGAGTDNRVAIHSDRYREQPLLIQGPGAGAQVTAAALLDDVLRIVRSI